MIHTISNRLESTITWTMKRSFETEEEVKNFWHFLFGECAECSLEPMAARKLGGNGDPDAWWDYIGCIIEEPRTLW